MLVKKILLHLNDFQTYKCIIKNLISNKKSFYQRDLFEQSYLIRKVLQKRSMSSKNDDKHDEREELVASAPYLNTADNQAKEKNELSDAIESLTRFFSKLPGSDDESNEHERVKKLSTLDMAGIVEYLPKCQNIIIMSGAGISTSAGIPDFRSPGTGLYSNLQKYKLPFPEAVFYLEFFKLNPNPFYSLCKELMPTNYKPTICHYFQRLLVEKANVTRVYTQNIDGLEFIANISTDKIITAHGSFAKGHCLDCKREYSFEWMKSKIYSEGFMRCEQCSSDEELAIVKPDIVFFGEQMPEKFLSSYPTDFPKCDLLIVMGSSLKVAPFNYLPKIVGLDCPRLLINREPAGDWIRSVYDEYEMEENYRDVFMQGDCDAMCMKLAEALNWKDELEKLVSDEHKKLDVMQNEATMIDDSLHDK